MTCCAVEKEKILMNIYIYLSRSI